MRTLLTVLHTGLVGSFGALLVFAALAAPPGLATTLTIGAEAQSDFERAEIVSSPQPVIPPELHEQCFKSCCIAKFIVREDGDTSVKLLSSSGSPQIDEITLDTLRKWRFKPAKVDGKPVESARKIKVEFEVE